MRLLRSFCAFLLSLFVLLTAFSNVSINACAYSGGAFLPVETALQYFGEEISATYYTSSGQQNATFRYTGTDNFDILFGYDSSLSNYDQDYYDYITNATFLIYSADLTGIVNDPTQIVLDISPTYSIFNTTQIISCVGASGTYYSPNAYISASWDWYYNSQNYHFESPTNTFGYGMRCTSYYGQVEYNLVPAKMSSQNATSGYSLRGVFPVADSTCYVCIGCPYVSAGSSGGSGASIATTTSTSSSGGGGGGDMSQTNGLLGGLIELVQGIPSAIAHIFIPTQEEITSWRESIADMLSDTFGDIPALHDQLEESISNIIGVSATNSITFPGIAPPGVGTIVPETTVPLKPSGFDSLFSMVRIGVDIVCTIWVFNMLQDKIKAFLVGETVVDKVGD